VANEDHANHSESPRSPGRPPEAASGRLGGMGGWKVHPLEERREAVLWGICSVGTVGKPFGSP
jgi:hypothetical protein